MRAPNGQTLLDAMNSSNRRPERRNRKIGTAASGYGQSNKMTIPNSRLDRFGIASLYQERIKSEFVEKARIGPFDVAILYEKPRPGFAYGCTPKDVVHLLSQVPDGHCDMIDLIVFRQPTRKQSQQHSVWGRLQYFAMIGDHIGAAIFLEAQEVGYSFKWKRKMSLESQAELQRLRDDGHLVEESKREFTITPTEESIRNTVLYRTLLHELGHWQQYEKEALDEMTALSDDLDVAYDLYFAKPTVEREQFAHRYASEMGNLLRKSGVIPFEHSAEACRRPLNRRSCVEV
jgi:hypothetical protein